MRLRVFKILLSLFLGGCSSAVCQEKIDSLSLSRKVSQAYKVLLAKPDSTIHLANSVLADAKEGNNEYFKGYGNYLLSKAFWAKGNYRLSTEYGFKALAIFENSEYQHLWVETSLSLARTLIDLRNFDQANAFLDRAMVLASTNDKETLLADVYREKSMLLLERRQYDSALYWADKGIALYETFGDTLHASILYGRKASAYSFLKNYKMSMTFNKKAILLDSLVGNKRALGIAYFQAALNEYNLNNTGRSIALLNSAMPLLEEMENFNTLIKAHTLLSKIYNDQHKPDLAFGEMQTVSQMKDSLYSAERNGQIQEMQSLYELGKKESKIQELELEKKNQRLIAIFLMIGIFLLLLLILALWRLRMLSKKVNESLALKNKAIEQQKEEMQAQAENLHQLNQLKSKLFSVISHDLRGPIGNLQALLELLTTRAMTPDEFVNISHKLKANLNVTQRTLENLLSWSLSQMEGIRTEQKRFDISSLIDEACHLMEGIAQRKNITVEKARYDSIAVMADLNQTQLILRNLLHNAIKFSKEDGKVLITAEPNDSYCHVSVRDYGIGMTSTETDMIMGKQQYFTKAGTHQEKGTGLGLLLCKEFIKRNGGSLSIDSHPGEGTAVSFTIPLAS